MNIQSVLLGAVLSMSTPFQPVAEQQATLGEQPYLFAIKNPDTNTQATFICHMIQEN